MKQWYRLALFNLIVLAFLGLLLRYKIIFSLPFLDYKNLIHAHSHFAFGGWITFLLQLLILDHFTNDYKQSQKFWNILIAATALVNYAMIGSFALTGYSATSIALSTLSIFISYAFCYRVSKAISVKIANNISTKFLNASLFFLLLSSIGPFALAALTAKAAHPNLLHNALHFFIYFQYAGWFTFSVLAFLFKRLEATNCYRKKQAQLFFELFTIGCVFGYLFVCLWNERPQLITIILIATAIVQTVSLVVLTAIITKGKDEIFKDAHPVTASVYKIAIGALVLKTTLQFLTISPSIEHIATMYRPISIAYLHLVFLVFISTYLLALLIDKSIILINTKAGFIGIISFITSIIVNEILLAAQAVLALLSINLQSLPVLLFTNTVIIVVGSLLVFISAINPASIINNHLPINTKLLKIIRWKL